MSLRCSRTPSRKKAMSAKGKNLANIIWLILSITVKNPCIRTMDRYWKIFINYNDESMHSGPKASINVEIDGRKNSLGWTSFPTSEARISVLGSPHSSYSHKSF